MKKSREIAEESEKTKKARKKLKDRLESIDKQVTEQALEKKSQDISRWIARHASERAFVEKEIGLFDSNQNAAKPSPGIAKILKELENTKRS